MHDLTPLSFLPASTSYSTLSKNMKVAMQVAPINRPCCALSGNVER
jgi:hypothetical protein